MQVSLTPEIQSIVQHHLHNGQYNCVDDIIETAIKLLDQHSAEEKNTADNAEKELAAAIQLGRDSLVNGRGAPYNLESIIQDSIQHDKLGLPISPDVQP